MTYRIALADDQSLVLDCIRKILAEDHDLEIVAEACDGAMLLELLHSAPVLPDLVITDITMPNVGGIEVTREVRSLYPDTKVLILTMHKDEEYFYLAMQAGAAGYLLKEDAGQSLISAVHLIRDGHTYVSPCLRPQLNGNSRSAQSGGSDFGGEIAQNGLKNGARRQQENPEKSAHSQKLTD